MKVLALLLVAAALAGCGSHHQASAEDVARAWSAALDRGDNEGAARLFAPNAQIVQTGPLLLATHADAVRWNAALPCGGKITSVTAQGANDVLVVFTLIQRPHHACDSPGSSAAALFAVRGGKIVLWHQAPVPQANTTPVI